nr:immunoglobulin heavy chain junction region [Mus musculus]NSM03664.1 immunoglobulin heavy chain junction region [Mus musculus]NSM03668.1 immunoglobulin heavy chain junction region [Mus musculus]NSM03686.1 immunoglobulin heavy chain junction region [Mus musculus]NSM03696.1 immunoglobulin heavy chain junction region [Mus musculus]
CARVGYYGSSSYFDYW